MSYFIVNIENFQSLSDVELVIEDGLNIVVGKTNAGKSATLRAINDALFNIGDDDKVKSGKRYATVSIDNGIHKMVWKRDSRGKSEKTSYQIDEDPAITKVGRNQLPEVAEYFGISDVKLANGAKEKINFWYQGAAPFLMDKTAGQLFEFLSQSSCDKYIKVIKKLEADIKVQKQQIEKTNAAIDVYRSINQEKQAYIDKNKGFDELYAQIEQVSNEIAIFNQIEELIGRMESSKTKVEAKSKEVDIIKKQLYTIDFGAIKIEYDNCYVLTDKMDKVSEYLMALDSKKNSMSVLSANLSKINTDYAVMNGNLGIYSLQVQELEELNAFVNDTKTYIETIKTKRSRKSVLLSELKDISAQIDVIDLEHLSSEIGIINDKDAELQALDTLMAQHSTKVANEHIKQRKIDDAVVKYNQAVSEFNAYKNEIGYCPYCDSKI